MTVSMSNGVDLGNLVTSKTDPVTGKVVISTLREAMSYESIYYAQTVGKLPKWRAALSKTIAGLANSKICIVGDSTDSGYASGRQHAVSQYLAKRLSASGLNVNTASQFGAMNKSTPASYASHDGRFTFGAGWTLGNITCAGKNAFRNASDTSAMNFTPLDVSGSALSFDTVDVYYINGSLYPNFTVSFDGGAAAWTSSMSGGGSIGKATVSVAAGTHTVNIQKTAASGELYILGIHAYDSTKKRVNVFTMAADLAKCTDMAMDDFFWNWKNVLAYVAPDLTIINCTLNDTNQATDVSIYSAEIQTLITAAKASGDVILRTGNPALGLDQSPYVAALRTLAVTNGIELLDVNSRCVSYAAMNSAGMMADSTHPTAAGYADISNAEFQMVQPGI